MVADLANLKQASVAELADLAAKPQYREVALAELDRRAAPKVDKPDRGPITHHLTVGVVQVENPWTDKNGKVHRNNNKFTLENGSVLCLKDTIGTLKAVKKAS